ASSRDRPPPARRGGRPDPALTRARSGGSSRPRPFRLLRGLGAQGEPPPRTAAPEPGGELLPMHGPVSPRGRAPPQEASVPPRGGRHRTVFRAVIAELAAMFLRFRSWFASRTWRDRLNMSPNHRKRQPPIVRL